MKINVVVLPGENLGELGDFIELIREKDLTVRFIEPMPFDGSGRDIRQSISGREILDRLGDHYEVVPLESDSGKVAKLFTIPGYRGRFGMIDGYSRNFCHACSRIRVSAKGGVRTCLYGQNVLDLRSLLRSGVTDDVIGREVKEILQHRFKDGFEAEQARNRYRFESMATVGG